MMTRRSVISSIGAAGAASIGVPELIRAQAPADDPVLDILHTTTEGIGAVLKEMEGIGFRSHHARLLAAHLHTIAAAKLERRMKRQLRAAEREQLETADDLVDRPDVRAHAEALGLDLTRPQYQTATKATRAQRRAALDDLPNLSIRVKVLAKALDRRAGELATAERGGEDYRIVAVRPPDINTCYYMAWVEFGSDVAGGVTRFVPGLQVASAIFWGLALTARAIRMYDCM